MKQCGGSSIGRASAFQAEGCEFEARPPHQTGSSMLKWIKSKPFEIRYRSVLFLVHGSGNIQRLEFPNVGPSKQLEQLIHNNRTKYHRKVN